MFGTRDSCKPGLHRVFTMFLLPCVLLPCLVLVGLAQTPPPTYTIIDLGTLGGPRSVGQGINASGQVAGWSDTDNTLDDGHPHAFLYTPGANPPMSDLGTLPGGLRSYGQSINGSGQITGWADPGTGAEHVFLYNGTMTDLRSGSFGNSNGFSINDSGWITGTMNIEHDGTHAFLMNPETLGVTDLTPDVPFGVGNSINSSGWVTGYSGVVETAHAFLYRNGTLLDLGTLSGGTYSIGQGINSSGQITGRGNTSFGEHAFLYSGGPGLVDLDPTGPTSQGLAINACGQIAGARRGHAFLYSAQKGFVNLNDVLPSDSGWDLVTASSINDHGQITGYGFHDGAERAFLLTPASEGAFVCTGNMLTPRTEHAATLLSGGNTVLITGGSAGGSTGSLKSAETYDVATGTFAALAVEMGTARYAHTATLLKDSSVLIAGGFDTHGGGFLLSAELYDPIERIFVPTGGMSFARQNHTATLLNNGKVLIAGGIVGASPLSSAELYDPAASTFTPIVSMSSPRYGHAATLLGDGRVLITGGCTAGHPDCVNTAELYDPIANTFTPTGPMQDVHAWHTATLLGNGTVLIAGGNQGTVIASAEVYEPSSGTFTAASSMVGMTAVYHTGTTLLDGNVLIAGGSWGTPTGVTDQAQLYSPLTGKFSLVTGTMSTTRLYHTATLLGNGQVLIAGGEDASNTVLASADLYQAPQSIKQTLSSGGGTARFIFQNNLYNIVFQYPAGYIPNDGTTYSLTVTPLQTSQAAWGGRTPDDNPYHGTQLAPVAGLGGDGIIYRAVCVNQFGNPCPPNSDLSYTITTSWKGDPGTNPAFLKAEIGSNTWENVFVSYSPTRTDGGPDPTGSGKSNGGWSDWAFVYNVAGPLHHIQITTPGDGATYTRDQVVNASYACTPADTVRACLGSVPNGAAIDTSSVGTKAFAVHATVSEGFTADQTITYSVVEPCHYAWFTLNPSTVPLGGGTKVTANLQSCSNVSQKVALRFTWTVPVAGSCSSNTSVILTTPTFLLKPKTSISLTFPLWIPKRICTGTYSVSASTLVGGAVVDTTSSSLTVTSN